MDAIATLAFELEPTSPALASVGQAPAGNSASVFEVAHFDAAFAAAGNTASAPITGHTMQVSGSESQGFRTVMTAFENLNGHAESLGTKALQMQHGQMRPSDMLMMTLKAQEFLFHCELTSNVANRTSEGVQQLFREQS
jgi:hypothetical protein